MRRASPTLVTVPHAETAAELQQHWRALHTRERAALSPGARDVRRRDFVAGRRAATLAAKAFGLPSPVLVLGRTEAPRVGQPEFWREHEGDLVRVENAVVSISHAATVAVAAVAARPVGVDLVEVQAFESDFAADVFVAGERQRWQRALGDASDAEVTAIAFAAKEAALKIVGEGLRIPLLDIEVQPSVSLDDTGAASAVFLRRGEKPQPLALRVTSSGLLRQVLLWEPLDLSP